MERDANNNKKKIGKLHFLLFYSYFCLKEQYASSQAKTRTASKPLQEKKLLEAQREITIEQAIHDREVPPCCVLNIDHTELQLTPSPKKTLEQRGATEIPITCANDKRQIQVLCVSEAGDTHPLCLTARKKITNLIMTEKLLFIQFFMDPVRHLKTTTLRVYTQVARPVCLFFVLHLVTSINKKRELIPSSLYSSNTMWNK